MDVDWDNFFTCHVMLTMVSGPLNVLNGMNSILQTASAKHSQCHQDGIPDPFPRFRENMTYVEVPRNAKQGSPFTRMQKSPS
eukprot:3571924-Karenia_brevis.AAC.1